MQWYCEEATVRTEDDQGLGGVTMHPDRLFRLSFLANGDHLRGNCSAGQLTLLGFQQQEQLGERLHAQYVQTGFLSASLSESEVYVRSTAVPRTQASAQVCVHIHLSLCACFSMF